MKKRLFLAIPLPEIMHNSLDLYRLSIEESIKPLEWIKRENLHLTLYFLGSIDALLIDQLITCYAAVVAKHHQFILSFKWITCAPLQNPGRMIWAEFSNNIAFQALINDTQAEIKTFFTTHNIHFKHDSRTTIPHVTLARAKNSIHTTLPMLPPLTLPNLEINNILLMESQPGDEGSKYTTLETFKLPSKLEF